MFPICVIRECCISRQSHIVDFYAPKAKIVVEVDASQHAVAPLGQARGTTAYSALFRGAEPSAEGLRPYSSIHPRACPGPSGAWVKFHKIPLLLHKIQERTISI